MRNLSRLLTVTGFASALCVGAASFGASPAAAQQREHFSVRGNGFHESFRGNSGFRSGAAWRGGWHGGWHNGWHGGYWRGGRWYPGVSVGFYGYPYAYGYPYGHGYYGDTCDPYSAYYDPYYCD